MRALLITFFTFCSYTVTAQLFVKSIYDPSPGSFLESSTLKRNIDSTYDVYTAQNGLIHMYLDRFGNIISTNTISIAGHTWHGLVEIGKISDSQYIIAGSSYQFPYKGNVTLVKMNSDGNPLWVRSIGGFLFGESAANIKNAQDNGFIIAGVKGYGTTSDEMPSGYLLKTDSLGNVLFAKGFHLGGGGSAVEVIETGSAFFTIGQTANFFGPSFAYLLKTDKYGNTIWAKSYDSTFIAATSFLQDGNFFVLAGQTVETTGDAILMKVDTFGNPLWSRQYHFDETSYTQKIIRTTDGGYLISGIICQTPYVSNSRSRVFFIKTDSSGNMLWCKKFGSQSQGYNGRNMIQDLNGNFTSIGEYYQGSLQALLMFNTDSAGHGYGVCEEGYDPAVFPVVIGQSALTFTETFYNDSSSAYPFTVFPNGMVAVDSCIIGTEGIANVSVNSINLYPNPSTGNITIETSVSNCEIEVYNFRGERVYSKTMSGKTGLVDLTQCTRGLYLCVVKGPDGSLWRRAFVLQ